MLVTLVYRVFCSMLVYRVLGCMLYRVLILVMYAAGGCVSAIMVWVAGQARFPGSGQRETLITL